MTSPDTTLPYELTERGIRFTAPPTFDDWRREFEEQVAAKNRSAWAIGDLVVLAEDANPYGEDYADVFDGVNLSLRTVSNYASVSRRFPIATRVFDLSHSHYMAVSKLAGKDWKAAMDILHAAATSEPKLDRDDVRKLAVEALGETARERVEAHATVRDGRTLVLDAELPTVFASGARVRVTVVEDAA